MGFFSDLAIDAGTWIQANRSTVSLMIVATLLVVYGGLINGFVRTVMTPFHFLVRVAAFVLLCAFGYGLITVVMVPWVAKAISLVPALYLFPVVLAVFLVLGMAAERKRV